MKFWLFQYVKSSGDNFGVVTPSLYRSAQPSRKDLERYIRKYKIGAVLNLRDDDVSKYQKDAAGLGLMFYNVPMSDKAAPTDEQIERCLQIMRGTVRTVVGCIGARHRTGAVCAVYRVVVQGWDKTEAWEEAYKYGFYRFNGHGPIEDWFLRDFEARRFRR